MHGEITTLKTVNNKSFQNIVTTRTQGSWVPSPVRRLKRGWSGALVPKLSPELAVFRSVTLKSATYLIPLFCPRLLHKKHKGYKTLFPNLLLDKIHLKESVACLLCGGAACGQWATKKPWMLQYRKVHIFRIDTNKSKLHACRH
jgi:hypothetical protein